MRSAEIHQLLWSDVKYSEGLIAVRAKLKKGKERYVPMTPELAAEIRRYPAVIGEERIFPPKGGRRANVRDWKEVLMICSSEQRFGISGSTICVTPSRPGA